MDTNAANMNELFKVFNAAFTEGMQATGKKMEEDLSVDEAAMMGVSTSTSAVHAWLNQIPSIRKWVGDRVVNNISTNKLEVVNDDYENTVAMPRNAIVDDQYGLYSPLVRAMGVDASNLWIKLAVSALVGNATWVDGKAFFATDRTYGSNTINNTGTSALEESTFETALQALQSFKGSNDEPLEVAPRYLVVGPKLRGTAWNLVKNQFVAGGTATTKFAQIQNRLQGICELRVSRRLVGTYDDYWFVLGDMGGIKPVYVQKREEPVLTRMDLDTDESVFNRNEVRYGVRARGAAFLTLPHLAYAGIVS